MGKAGKLRKKRRLEQQQNPDLLHSGIGCNGTSVAMESEHQSQGIEIGGHVIHTHEILAATKVINAMANSPEAFKGKEYKSLRASLHSLRQSEGASMVLGFGKKDVSLTQVVSDALRDQRWTDALHALEKMRFQKTVPKLGAVCRWVRECDAAGDDDPQAMTVLDGVLRTADPSQIGWMSASTEARQSLKDVDGNNVQGELRCGGRVLHYPPWDPVASTRVKCLEGSEGQTMVAAQALPEAHKQQWRSKFRLCLSEKGELRKPPNNFPLRIHTSEPNAVSLDDGGSRHINKISVPFLPSSCMLENVLSERECLDIIHAGESVGYDPDQPIGGSAVEKRSVLAHAFVWCTDKEFIDKLWLRVKDHLPKDVGGAKPVGINRRFRCYRYVPGAVYRPHIDGAWPGSGLDEVTGDYQYDAFGDGRWSRLTFLMYLNDDFDGGWTTYFAPSKERVGLLEARGVRPKRGCVMLFPHGDALGALLHEGSSVTKGAKYIIRTDVLYL